MFQKDLTSTSGQAKPGEIHDDNNKKKKAGTVNAIDPADSDKRSWLQSRTVALVLEAHPDGNSFTEEFWSKCYAQAKEEWDGRQ